MDTQHLTESRFSDLNLPDRLLQGLNKAGFSHCTPIQAETLPYTLAGKDLAGQAQTGTGKTIAFLLPLFARLLQAAPAERRDNQPRALVLAPTRELAIQIAKDAELIGAECGQRIALLYGGTGYEQQRAALEAGSDILIGTPGRLIDFFKQRLFDLRAIEVLVLDEADRMFDLGFIKDIRYLLRRLPHPEKRLSMLFSATLTYRVNELAYEHMNNPHGVEVAPEQVTAERVEQRVYFPASEEKIPLLLGLLKQQQPQRAIIFVNTKRVAERLHDYLEANGHRAALLSGDVPQKKRQRLLELFEQGEFGLLVATDVAARGLHIPEVSHVFNYDLPNDSEDYVHRIGRTARAGARGHAISFACEEYAFSLGDIESYIQQKIPVEPITADLLAEEINQPAKRPRPKHPHGKRHSGARGNHRRKPHPSSS